MCVTNVCGIEAAQSNNSEETESELVSKSIEIGELRRLLEKTDKLNEELAYVYVLYVLHTCCILCVSVVC